MDYLYYVLAVLVIGLVSIVAVRVATRSRNPDLLMQYEARKKAAKMVAEAQKANKANRKRGNGAGQAVPEIKSLRERHMEKVHYRTPWGWPGAQNNNGSQGISHAVRSFTDRLVREKQLIQSNGSANGNGSIRALLEDRYGPVNRGMPEIPYEKVKRPLLRDPNEQHDQLDNLGSAETRRLRRKLQLLSTMNGKDAATGNGLSTRKTEFRYVELKDIKQPWGW